MVSRWLTSYNPFTYLLLLAALLAFSWPAWNAGWIGEAEAFQLTVGRRLADGNALYQEAVVSMPPLLAYLQKSLHEVFGSYTLVFLRVFRLLYILICGILLMRFFNAYRFGSSYSAMPLVLFAIGSVAFWDDLSLHSEMLLILPALLIWELALQEPSRRSAWRQPFQIGLLLGLSVLLDLKAVVFVPAAIAALSIVRALRLEDIINVLGGFCLILTVTAGWFLWNGSLTAAWTQTIEFALHEFRSPFADTPGDSMFRHVFSVWGGLMILSLIGFLAYRTQLYSNSIRSRQAENVVAIWAAAAVLMVLLAQGTTHLGLYFLVFPCLVFYTSYLADGFAKGRWGYLVLMGVLLLPLHYLSLNATLQQTTVSPKVRRYWDFSGNLPYLEALRQQHQQLTGLAAKLPAADTKPTLWVTGPSARPYVLLNYAPGNRYLETDLAAYLLWGQPADSLQTLPHLSLPVLYKAFVQHKPTVILGTQPLFGQMSAQLPLLLSGYSKREDYPYTLWVQQP